MHATGVGKVLLAHSPNDVRDRVMANLVSLGACSLAVPVA
jgi:DNA-binding IclR family transcriptional regulator